MGCGKSSIGRRLSELLCCPFMDLDEEIEARAGRSIPEIFAEDGEGAFREMELETLKGILYADSERLCTPLAPSHSGAAGPSPYAGGRKYQMHILKGFCRYFDRASGWRDCQPSDALRQF